MKTYQIDENGYYGKFGGAYIPEILHQCVTELQEAYRTVLDSEPFKKEYHRLLRDYAGRPSPLFLSGWLSRKYGFRVLFETGRPEPYRRAQD